MRADDGSRKVRSAITAIAAALVMLLVPASGAGASPGQLFVFGSNFLGELGSTVNEGVLPNANPTPALLNLPGATGQVVQAATGASFSLVLTSTGQLYAFGYDTSGQLGSPTPMSGRNSTPTQVTLPGASGPIVQVAAGEASSLAVTASGQLYSFGENRFGELGRETNAGTTNPTPAPVQVFLPGAVGPVVRAVAGAYHALAITSSGQLYAFGANGEGELGNATNNGSPNPNPSPVQVSLPGASGPVVQAAAGNGYSLAVTSTGQLFTFGSNRYGALGRPENSGSFNPTPTPGLVSLPGASGPVVEVSGGSEHSYAVTASGQLYAFGDNQFGELGIAANAGTENPNPTPSPVSMPGPIVQIGGGEIHGLAVTSTGQLLSFGSNSEGELGRAADAGTGNATPTPGLVELPPGTTIDSVARGQGSHSLVLSADIAVLTNTLPAGSVGVAYGAQPVAAGGMGAYSWSATGLPAGLSINSLSGQISGTPTTAGVTNVVLHVSDGFGVGASTAAIPLTIVSTGAAGALGFTVAELKATELKASLLAQLTPKGKAAKLASLAKQKSYSYSFTALSPGKLTITWYFLPKGAHISRKATPVPFASGQLSFKAPGTKKITIKLTTKGKSLIKHKSSIKLTARGSFTPTGKKAITALKTFKLTR
jgi:alpha-tubulin suppressor-like RCC1 family protein